MGTYTYQDKTWNGPFFPPGLDGGTRTTITITPADIGAGSGYDLGNVMIRSGTKWYYYLPNRANEVDRLALIEDVGWCTQATPTITIQTVPWSVTNLDHIAQQPMFDVRFLNRQPGEYFATLTKSSSYDIYTAGDPVYMTRDNRITKTASQSGAISEYVGNAFSDSPAGTLTVDVYQRLRGEFPTYNDTLSKFSADASGKVYPSDIQFWDRSPDTPSAACSPTLARMLISGEVPTIRTGVSTSFDTWGFCTVKNPDDPTEPIVITGTFFLTQPDVTVIGYACRIGAGTGNQYAVFKRDQIQNIPRYQQEGMTKGALCLVVAPPQIAFDLFTLPTQNLDWTKLNKCFYTVKYSRNWNYSLNRFIDGYYVFLFPIILGFRAFPLAWKISSLTPTISPAAPSNAYVCIFGPPNFTTVDFTENAETALLASPYAGALPKPTDTMPIDTKASIDLHELYQQSRESFYFNWVSSATGTNHILGGYADVPDQSQDSKQIGQYNFNDYTNMRAFSQVAPGSSGITGKIVVTPTLDRGAGYNNSIEGLVVSKSLGAAITGFECAVPTWTTDDMPYVYFADPLIDYTNGSGIRSTIQGTYLYDYKVAHLDYHINDWHFDLPGISINTDIYVGHGGTIFPQPVPALISPSHSALFGGGGFDRVYDLVNGDFRTGSVTVTHAPLSSRIERITVTSTMQTKEINYPSGFNYLYYSPTFYVIRTDRPEGFSPVRGYFLNTTVPVVYTYDVPRGYQYLIWVPETGLKTYIDLRP